MLELPLPQLHLSVTVSQPGSPLLLLGVIVAGRATSPSRARRSWSSWRWRCLSSSRCSSCPAKVWSNVSKDIVIHEKLSSVLRATPRIHYGNIGSANKLIKDSKTRNKLRKNPGVLCVEMGSDGIWAAAEQYHLLLIYRDHTTIILPKPIILLSRETSGSVTSVIVQYFVASSYGDGSKQFRFKDAWDKVNYLRFCNYTSNTLHKPKMSRILLEVVLPVFVVLKFDYKYVGNTILHITSVP